MKTLKYIQLALCAICWLISFAGIIWLICKPESRNQTLMVILLGLVGWGLYREYRKTEIREKEEEQRKFYDKYLKK